MQDKLVSRLFNTIDDGWHGLNSGVVTNDSSKMVIPQPAHHCFAPLQPAHLTGAYRRTLLRASHLTQCLGHAESDQEDIPRSEGYPLPGSYCF